MTKAEREMALKACGEILASFKNAQYDTQPKKGIFSNLDTTQAEAL